MHVHMQGFWRSQFLQTDLKLERAKYVRVVAACVLVSLI